MDNFIYMYLSKVAFTNSPGYIRDGWMDGWRSASMGQAEAAAVQIGKSFSRLGGTRSMGLLSKKLTGLRSKLEDTVGMMG